MEAPPEQAPMLGPLEQVGKTFRCELMNMTRSDGIVLSSAAFKILGKGKGMKAKEKVRAMAADVQEGGGHIFLILGEDEVIATYLYRVIVKSFESPDLSFLLQSKAAITDIQKEVIGRITETHTRLKDETVLRATPPPSDPAQ